MVACDQCMETKLMKVCCDFCRGKLGLMVHRYWRMRFCSSTCVQGYERRLDEIKARLRLDFGGGCAVAKVDDMPGSSAAVI